MNPSVRSRPFAAPALPAPEASSPALPAAHFAVALVFFALGALGLVWIAPDLAHGTFYLRRVAAVVHLFTLGWLVLSIFGALCQFLPVAVGRPLRSRHAAQLAFVAQTVGALGLVLGLLTETRPLLHAGAGALALAFAVFALNLAATLAAVAERGLTWWALAGAALFLLVTPVFGVVLATGQAADRFVVVAEHAHIAFVGVVMLVVVGVAHRLLPMFLLSHGGGARAGWVAAASFFACAALLAVPVASEVRLALAGALGCAGVGAFVVQAVTYFRHRKRRALDAGMRLAGMGIAALALAALLAPFALQRGMAAPRLLCAYFVVLLGGVALFVAGHYYRIVPFLVWFHRFGPHVGKRPVPKVAELYSAGWASLEGALLGGGWLGLALATLLGAADVARASAAVFAAGALLEVGMIAQIARRRVA
ncbi:MAG: hypothetical protein IT373_01935 [Polyangiaceae bacterium]|nr:hypothetical protein [Polyangiaceae bacterium]